MNVIAHIFSKKISWGDVYSGPESMLLNHPYNQRVTQTYLLVYAISSMLKAFLSMTNELCSHFLANNTLQPGATSRGAQGGGAPLL